MIIQYMESMNLFQHIKIPIISIDAEKEFDRIKQSPITIKKKRKKKKNRLTKEIEVNSQQSLGVVLIEGGARFGLKSEVTCSLLGSDIFNRNWCYNLTIPSSGIPPSLVNDPTRIL